MVNFQIVDSFNLRENDDKEKIYIIWDFENQEALHSNWDVLKKRNATFSKFKFPNHIKGQYKHVQNN